MNDGRRVDPILPPVKGQIVVRHEIAKDKEMVAGGVIGFFAALIVVAALNKLRG